MKKENYLDSSERGIEDEGSGILHQKQTENSRKKEKIGIEIEPI